MDLDLSPEHLAFRDEVRSFIRDRLPDDIGRKVELGHTLEKDDYVRWQRALHDKGWMAPGWPVEHGGTGWDPVRRYIFEEELGAAPTPRIITFGVKMVAPVIIAFGTDAQKARYLPRILSSEDWWCQGYSEPGSGSDLASLRTRAELDGDHYIVNGQKAWTTLAQYADMIFCLVRTSSEGRKQEGITFLLIDMKSPGITVHPIVTMEGGREINDVFFDDVRVPVENRVGEEGKGWTYAKFLLGHERVGIADVPRSKRELEQVRAIAAAEQAGGRPLIEDERFREHVARIEIDLMALEYTALRVLAAESAGRTPGAEASLLKIRGTEIHQEITELAFEAAGHYALVYEPGARRGGANLPGIGPQYAASTALRYFNYRKSSIYGGSNEIQRNIIAKAVLGL